MEFHLEQVFLQYQSECIVVGFIAVVFTISYLRKKKVPGDSFSVPAEEPSDPYAAPEQSSITSLEGEDHGISWKLESMITVRYDSHGSQLETLRSTHWQSSSVGLPAGGYILLQALETPYAPPSKGKKNFLSGFLEKVGEMALDIYVTKYFGEQYTGLVNIEGSQPILIPGLPKYFILSNTPALAKSILEGSAGEVIRIWREGLQGFEHEEEVDLLGILVHEKGVLAGCMTTMGSEEEARKLADFMSSLCSEVKKGMM